MCYTGSCLILTRLQLQNLDVTNLDRLLTADPLGYRLVDWQCYDEIHDQ